jgi:micrococcal nuclease
MCDQTWVDNFDSKTVQDFVPPITSGYVIKVYDGDTITICSKLPYPESPIYKFQVRLNGIDTPEMKSKNVDEKTMAKSARDYLSEKIMNKWVDLKDVQLEKYGRILADVYLGEEKVNDLLLERRFAVKYGGGTKVSPVCWKAYHENGSLN